MNVRNGEGRPAADIQDDVSGLSLSLREIAAFYRRRWMFIGFFASLGLAVALFFALTLDPRYKSTAQVVIEVRADVFEETFGTSVESSLVDSQIHVLSSRALLQGVVQNVELYKDPEFSGRDVTLSARISNFISRALPSLGTFANANVGQAATQEELLAVATRRLREAVEVDREGRSNVISIQVTSRSPKKAAYLANSVVDAYLRDRRQKRNQRIRSASSWLTDRTDTLQAELKEAEDAVERYKIDNNLVVSRSGTVAEQQLFEVNTQLIEAKAALAERVAAYQQAESLLTNGGDVYSIPEVIASEVVNLLRSQHAEASRRETKLLATYGARNPQVVLVRGERMEIEQRLTQEVGRVVESLANEAETARTREAVIAESLAEATGQTGIESEVVIGLRELERVAEARQTIYDDLLIRSQVVEAGARFKSEEVEIVSAASVPDAPSFPPKKVLVLFGLVLGGSLGTLGALAREALQTGLMTARQAERLLGLPVIASVSKLAHEPLSRTHDPQSRPQLPLRGDFSYWEAVRTIRHTLFREMGNPPVPVLQVTSAVAGEGKTTMAISLAMSAAAAGHRVLLVDADLRRSGTTVRFGLQEAIGLTDVLTDRPEIEQALHSDDTGVTVLGAGTETLNPSDLLSSVRMQSLIDWARTSFDLVILDSAPVENMADAGIVSRIADKVAFVVRWSATPGDVVRDALTRIEVEKAVCVLNAVDLLNAAGYGQYHGNYGEQKA